MKAFHSRVLYKVGFRGGGEVPHNKLIHVHENWSLRALRVSRTQPLVWAVLIGIVFALFAITRIDISFLFRRMFNPRKGPSSGPGV